MIDTLRHQFTLPITCLDKVRAVLAKCTPSLQCNSWKHWDRLVGILRSTNLYLPGGGTLFGNLKLPLYQGGGHLFLMDAMYLVLHPTRLIGVLPSTPMLHGTQGACQWVLGGVFCGPQHHPCLCPPPPASCCAWLWPITTMEIATWGNLTCRPPWHRLP